MNHAKSTDKLYLLRFEGISRLTITIMKFRLLLLLGVIPTLLITFSDVAGDLMQLSDTHELWAGMVLSFGGLVFSACILVLLYYKNFIERLSTSIQNYGAEPKKANNIRLGVNAGILFLSLAWLGLYQYFFKGLWIGYGSLVFWWLFVFLISSHWLLSQKTHLQVLPAFSVSILLIVYVSIILGTSFLRIGEMIRTQTNYVTSSGSTPTPTPTLTSTPTPAPTPTAISAVPLIPHAFRDNGMVLNALAGASSVPTADDLTVGPGEDLFYLQSILDTIFPNGTSGLTEEQISISILKYVSTYMLLKTNTGSATKMLQEGYAICGGMSISFQALARLAGIPARYVGIFGVPYLGNHAIAEVYYAGQWHLYDPTYGMIFYTEPEYNSKGKIPSLAEVRSGALQSIYLFKAVDHPWLGKYDADEVNSFNVTRAEDTYLSDYYGYDFISSYRLIFSISFPNTMVQLPILSFPVDVDFTRARSMSVGKLDRDVYDMLLASAEPQTAGRVGSHIIGGGGAEEVETWFIKSSIPGYFRITYYSTETDPPRLLLFPLKAIYVVDWRQENGKAEFILHMSDTGAALQFWAEDGIFWIDKWQADWLGQSFVPIQ
jgi:hypothetical protein